VVAILELLAAAAGAGVVAPDVAPQILAQRLRGLDLARPSTGGPPLDPVAKLRELVEQFFLPLLRLDDLPVARKLAEEPPGDALLHVLAQLIEHLERTALELDLRVALAERLQRDALPQIIDRGEVLPPLRVDDGQHQRALVRRDLLRPDGVDAALGDLNGVKLGIRGAALPTVRVLLAVEAGPTDRLLTRNLQQFVYALQQRLDKFLSLKLCQNDLKRVTKLGPEARLHTLLCLGDLGAALAQADQKVAPRLLKPLRQRAPQFVVLRRVQVAGIPPEGLLQPPHERIPAFDAARAHARQHGPQRDDAQNLGVQHLEVVAVLHAIEHKLLQRLEQFLALGDGQQLSQAVIIGAREQAQGALHHAACVDLARLQVGEVRDRVLDLAQRPTLVVLAQADDLAFQRLLDEAPHQAVEVAALATQDLHALLVHDLALAVHRLIVLDEVLADVKVVALKAGLRLLDGIAQNTRLDGHILRDVQPLHDALRAVAAEPQHELVLQRQVEARRTGVALARRTPAKLVIDTPRLVALCADNMQAAIPPHPLAVLAAVLLDGLNILDQRGRQRRDGLCKALRLGQIVGQHRADQRGAGVVVSLKQPSGQRIHQPGLAQQPAQRAVLLQPVLKVGDQ